MPPDEVKEKLRELGRKANAAIPYLNFGGCGVFAHAVAQRLEKLGYPSEVVVYSPGGEDMLPDLKHAINNDRKALENGWPLYHLGVRTRIAGVWHTYDSDALRRSRTILGDRPPVHVPDDCALTVEEAEVLVDQKHLWNDCFNRRKYLQPLRKLVRETLS